MQIGTVAVNGCLTDRLSLFVTGYDMDALWLKKSQVVYLFIRNK